MSKLVQTRQGKRSGNSPDIGYIQKRRFAEATRVWLRSFAHLPERLMARYLRRRGWVVFYLDEPARHCEKDSCWLRLYQEQSL